MIDCGVVHRRRERGKEVAIEGIEDGRDHVLLIA